MLSSIHDISNDDLSVQCDVFHSMYRADQDLFVAAHPGGLDINDSDSIFNAITQKVRIALIDLRDLLNPDVWSGCMVRMYGPDVWSGCMVRMYGPDVWSGGMVLMYGPEVCSGGMLRRYAPDVWS